MEVTSTYSLLPLVSSIFVIVLGFFVWFKKPKEWLHILFFLYCFTISIWLFGTFRLFNAQTDAAKIFWDRFIYIGVVFIPIFLYHFGLIYCDIKTQKFFLVIGYLLSLFFLPMSQTDYFTKDLYRYSWGTHTIAQPLHNFYLAYFFFYFILFFINLGLHYKKANGERKKQVKFILIGYAILDVIGPLAFLPAYGVPIYPVIFLSAIPFALFLAYAIIKHNALDLKTITAEVVVTLLNLIALVEIFFSKTFLEFILRSLAFLAIFIFSLVLVRSVRKEIRRREEVTILAHSLEKANLRLQELDRQKTEFLSIASHQLRTPLSILKGYIELIQEGGYGKPTKALLKVLGDMDLSNEHLIKLVDEFLNISRIEQGRTKFVFKNDDLVTLVKDVEKELGMKARDNGFELEIKNKEKILNVQMDSEKIRHVVFNFVDNAIKYGKQGKIVVVVEPEDDGVMIEVKDQGLGFDKIDDANFFQKFYRGENVKGINVAGTGLGLYVCRKFIEAHGGKVWAHSKGVGHGSQFGFWLPLQTPKDKLLLAAETK